MMRAQPKPLLAPLVWIACAAALALASAACEREELGALCEPLAQGAVVFTELSGADWQWFEITNPGAAEVLLEGIRVQFSGRAGETDPTKVKSFTFREHGLSLPGGARLVAARFGAGQAPAWVDYSFGDELGAEGSDIPSSGVAEICNCLEHDLPGYGQPVDFISWSALPTAGSLALDGALTPDATANDDEAAWCQDSHVQTLGGGPYDTVLGSPGEVNPPCP